MTSRFIADPMPTPSCHASTIVESGGRMLAAWFGGKYEGHPSVGIWLSRLNGDTWSTPTQIATATGPDGQPTPCWNPVLFQPTHGPLTLFYKAGPSPDTWHGLFMTSADSGATWSPPRRLPDRFLGPIKNKPIELADGTILCPSSTEHDGWTVHLEWTRDPAGPWTKSPPLNDGKTFRAIQPALLRLADGDLALVCRSSTGRVLFARSTDASGRSWSELTPLDIANPDSGIDAVTLRDGRHLLVYNPTATARTPLDIAVSDDARTWRRVLSLETAPGEYSYPAVVQASDGTIHVTYTHRRTHIRHVTVDPAELA